LLGAKRELENTFNHQRCFNGTIGKRKASTSFAMVFFAVPSLDSGVINPKGNRITVNQCLFVLLPIADFVLGFAHHL
jgi:hypothetical protein